jgi:hypothetical protein
MLLSGGIMSATANVHVGYNNRLESSDAAKLIGCSYSHLIGIIKAKKVKAQKIEGQWLVDYDDANRYKSVFKPRMKSNKLTVIKTPEGPKKVEIKIEIEKDRLDLLALVLVKQNKTVPKYLNDKIAELLQRIDNSLGSVQV